MDKEKADMIIYTTEEGLTKVETTFDGDTVWLSIDQMAELFQRDKSTISRHIKNIFTEGELQRDSVVAKFATTASDGKVYNAVNEDLKDIQKMVNIVKRDGEVSLRYMKWFEHDQLMIDQGRQEERENTEKERKRADKAEQQVKEMEAITKYLIADKRFADLERAVDDLDFRKKLLKEYKRGE